MMNLKYGWGRSMYKDIFTMYRRSLFINLNSGTVITLAIFIIHREIAGIFAAGLIIAELNLLLNAFITYLLLINKGEKYLVFYTLSFIIRISAIALIGFNFFTYSRLAAAAYMLGYSSHFIGILFHAGGINNREKGSD